MFRSLAAIFPPSIPTRSVAVARSRPSILIWAVALYVCLKFWGPLSSGYASIALKIITSWAILGLCYSSLQTYRLMIGMYQYWRQVIDAMTVMDKALDAFFTPSMFGGIWTFGDPTIA